MKKKFLVMIIAMFFITLTACTAGKTTTLEVQQLTSETIPSIRESTTDFKYSGEIMGYRISECFQADLNFDGEYETYSNSYVDSEIRHSFLECYDSSTKKYSTVDEPLVTDYWFIIYDNNFYIVSKPNKVSNKADEPMHAYRAILKEGVLSYKTIKKRLEKTIIESWRTNTSEAVAKHEMFYKELVLLNQKKGDRGAALKIHDVAYTAYLSGDISGANQKWFEATKIDPSWEWGYYNLACTSTLLGERNLAMKYIILALDLTDGKMIHDMIKDSDLVPLYSTMKNKAREILPEQYFTSIAEQIYLNYLDGTQFIGFGEKNVVVYLHKNSSFTSSTIGGPDDPPTTAGADLTLVILDLKTSRDIEMISIYNITETQDPKNRSYEPFAASVDSQFLKRELISQLDSILPKLIFEYKIDFNSNSNIVLKREEKESVEIFNDKSTGVKFLLGSQLFYGTANSSKIEYDINEFGLWFTILDIYRKKEGPYFFILGEGMQGNGDSNYTRNICYLAKFENNKLTAIEMGE